MTGANRIALLALVAAILPAACSGAFNTGAVPSHPTPGAGASAPSAPHGAKHRVKAAIRISIPQRRHRRKLRIHGHYVSPATQSIAIAVTPQGGGTVTNYNADLTPATNPGCTVSTISSTICTISLQLAPGGYTATFATYDGLLAHGNAPYNPPTGNELSANQNVALTVVTGASNTIGVTLGGIPASLAIVPVNGATLSGSTASGFSISKCLSTENVDVVGIDADGNDIIGAGAPTTSLTSDTPAYLAVATPAPNAPNTFKLSGAFASGTPTASAIPAVGAVVHLTATVTPSSESGGSPVTVSSVPVTFDDSICGVVTEFTVPIASAAPYDIAAGLDGNLWFTENAANRIGRSTTAGTITDSSSYSNAGLRGIAPAPGLFPQAWMVSTEHTADNFFFWNTVSNTPYLLDVIDLPSAATPNGVTTAPSGIVYATDDGANTIDFYMMRPGDITASSYAIGTSGSGPQGIVYGPDSNVWFTESSANQIGQLNPTTGTIAEFSTGISAGAQPYGIAAGPDGNLWFTEEAGNRIARITTGGIVTEFSTGLSAGAQPLEIVAGPDGNLYFTELAGNRIGRITSAGIITEFSSGISTGAGPHGITVGPDDNLWFTEIDGDRIARMQ